MLTSVRAPQTLLNPISPGKSVIFKNRRDGPVMTVTKVSIRSAARYCTVAWRDATATRFEIECPAQELMGLEY